MSEGGRSLSMRLVLGFAAAFCHAKTPAPSLRDRRTRPGTVAAKASPEPLFAETRVSPWLSPIDAVTEEAGISTEIQLDAVRK